MNMIRLKPIGIVANEINEPADLLQVMGKPSTIFIHNEYKDGLLDIEKYEFLDIVFYFHRSDGVQLSAGIRSGDVRGVFASRSPDRPNAIGITTVKLLEHRGNQLVVEGLDAINYTPVLDIKSHNTSLFASELDSNPALHALLKADPRIEIRNCIRKGRQETLLIKAAQIHGHFCPGLAMGVMAAAYAMKEMKTDSDGMEDLLAITETNNCFSDGVQFVTGCSFGNNALIFKDVGKTAFTLTKRDGHGLRIGTKPESGKIIRESFPDFQQYYQQVVANQNHDPELVSKYKKVALERAFGTLKIPFDQLFFVQNIHTEISNYASISDSVICKGCGENIMKSRSKYMNEHFYCFECAAVVHAYLDGDGIHL
ncbi:MAG: TrmO family methyltransferase [Cytophagales bacterium]|nr:TrmO family methyltransferase [Cytophagales bacterium]